MVSKKFWLVTRYLLCTACLLIATSCSGLLNKEGSVFPSSFAEFVRGDLYSTEEVSIKRMAKAIPQGLKDLGYRISHEEVGKTSGNFTAEGSGEKLIRISIEKKSRVMTEIRIRVGLDGDEPLSRFVLAKIKTRL